MAELSPLRRRMIEDMTIRNLSPATQRAYSNASGHAFQYEAGRGFRFEAGHPACFYRSFLMMFPKLAKVKSGSISRRCFLRAMIACGGFHH